MLKYLLLQKPSPELYAKLRPRQGKVLSFDEFPKNNNDTILVFPC